MDKLVIFLLRILSAKAYPTHPVNGGSLTFGHIKAPYDIVEVSKLNALEPGVHSSPYVVASQIVEESGTKNDRATLVRFSPPGPPSDCQLALNFPPGRFSEVHIGKPGQVPVNLNIYMVALDTPWSLSYGKLDPISEPWRVVVAPGLQMPNPYLYGSLSNGSANYLVEIASSVDTQMGVSWRNEIREYIKDPRGSFGIFLVCE